MASTSRFQRERILDGVYPAHPSQWCLISPSSDAIIDVEAFDKNGNQLPFYTGTRDDKVICQSDAVTNDGILRVDFGLGSTSGLCGVPFLCLKLAGAAIGPADFICRDSEVPGLPDGTVSVRITLRRPDSSGEGVTLAAYGWDLDSDGVVQSSRDGNTDVLEASDWYTQLGRSGHAHSDSLAASSTLGIKLFTPGQSITIGWGGRHALEFNPAGDALIADVALNAGANASYTLFAPRLARLGYSVTAAGAGTLTSDLYAMQGPGGTVYDDSVVDSDVITFSGAGSKDVHWDVPAGMHSLKLSAATANMTSITIRVLPLE